MYKIIDYFTGKQPRELTELFNSEKEASLAKNKYLKRKIEEKLVHNNLLLIEKI